MQVKSIAGNNVKIFKTKVDHEPQTSSFTVQTFELYRYFRICYTLLYTETEWEQERRKRILI